MHFKLIFIKFKSENYNIIKLKKTEFLASRWAAKEALYKCFQGEKSWAWVCQFSVLPGKNRAPSLSHPELTSCQHIAISLSHEKKMAIAFVQAEF